MSQQPFAFQAEKQRNFIRIGAQVFAILALLAFVLGSFQLCIGWFGVGMSTAGTFGGQVTLARNFLFSVVWPITMLVVWVCSLTALLLAKRWVLASLSLPAALAVLFSLLWLVPTFMLNLPAVTFTAFFLLLNIGAIWLALWLLRNLSA